MQKSLVRDEFGNYWKTVIDTIMEGLVVVDTDGVILSVNKAIEGILGYSPDELVGKSCLILDCDKCFHIDASGKKRKSCQLFNINHAIKRRCTLKRKDGKTVHILKHATQLRDAEGNVIGGVETLTDITDLVDKEKTIEDLKEVISPNFGFEGIIGTSSKMMGVRALIKNAASSDAPVIIYGESGTGKELVANAIHRLGKRKRGPFMKVACAVLNESILESELFGHVKGAFTGADRDRKGRFEAAHKGDIFLDEIGDIPLSTQVKLLRVLQEKEIERVGDQRPIKIDVRIIAATHRDLNLMCYEGRFREDLFYRLNVIPIFLPPLREKREDIPLLVDYYMRAIRARSGKMIHGVTESAMEKMISYHWPGNVRELINVLEYAFVVCHDELISHHHLPNQINKEKIVVSAPKRFIESRYTEKERLLKILGMTKGNRKQAAYEMGISRVTLWKLMKRYGIKVETTIREQ